MDNPTFSKPQRLSRNGKIVRHYYVRVNEGGRRTWRSTGQITLGLAKQVLDTWRLRAAKGERHIEDISFAEAAAQWLGDREPRIGPKTHEVYKFYVNLWSRHFKAARLLTVERRHLEAYFRKRKARGLSPASLNDERALLRRFFTWSLNCGFLRMNPMAFIDRFQEPKRAIRTLEPEEELRLLEEARKCGDQVYGFVMTLLQSGLRRGTVSALEWTDIDFDRGEWRIPAGKMKSREDFVGRPVAPELLKYLRGRARTSGIIFGKLSAEQWRLATTAAGLSWLRPHDLRRNFVTRCRRAGISLEVAMHLSDHRDLATVLACYRRVDPSETRKAMASLFQKVV
ncbi:MAG: tyrosine-type recombinase/integrase [Planctomycetes bacterium]|nr:tyrosine-type recombinase/integrase [Planctomycetota bacterium]